MISRRIKEVLEHEVRCKEDVEQIVSHLVSKLFRAEKIELSYAVKLILRQCFSPTEVKR